MYLYSDLITDLTRLRKRGAKVFSAGRSALGEDIPAFTIGSKPPVVLLHAGIHAREHVTVKLLMRLVRDFVPKHSTLVVVPVANPDGMRIATEGVTHLAPDTRDFSTSLTPDVRTIKCNARGVDLNVNFDARWGEGVQNVFVPSAENYVGPCLESEPETQALVALTRRFRPVVSVSWHARGSVIYWTYGMRPDYEAEFGEMAGKYRECTGFPLLRAEGSVGGYKDWFIASGYGMGLTIEVGSDDLPHHRLYEEFDDILDKTKEVLALVDEHAGIIYRRKVYARSHY